MKFNRLTPIEFVRYHKSPSGKSHPIWKFQCDCGNTHEANAYLVRKGHTKSCGCLQVESRKSSQLIHGGSRRGQYSRLYVVWNNMKQRCQDPNSTSYKYYGAKGVRVEWASYQDFVRDMESGWSAGLTIDRKDSSGNYSKGNCRWATIAEQNRNRSSNRYFELNGERMILEDWAKKLGIKPMTISARIKRGWSVEKSLTTPLKS